MANTQLSVNEINTPVDPRGSISRANRRSSLEVSRAQMASSDGHRGPRRPSMNFETSARLPEVPTEHERRENGHAWTEERMVTRADRDTRVSGHRQRQHEHNHSRARGHPGHVHGAQQARLTPESIHSHNYHHHDNHHYSHHHHHHHSSPDEARRREFRGVGSATTRDSYDDMDDQRFVVPALPMPIAVMCCILNFIFPGLGSMTAGLCVLCCGDTEGMTSGEKCGSCCTVFGIGLLQLLLVACFLVGWIWSCIWGITFIGMSASYYDNDDDYYNEEQYHHQQLRSNNPVYRDRNRQGQSSRLPTPQVVVDQPYPGVHYEDLQRERRSRRTASRRTRSRISLTPSNLIYPMRAPSNITYNSPPPPYPESPPPVYTTQSRTVLPSVIER